MTLTTAVRPSRTSSPRQVLLDVLEQPCRLAGRIDRAGESAAEPAEVRAAIDGVDVVREAENVLGVAVVVLQRDFHREDAAVRHLALGLEMNRLFVQDALAAVQMLDELGDAAARNETRVLFTGSSRSSVSVIFRPLFRNASSRRRCARVSKLNTVASMMVESGLNVILRAGLLARLCPSASAAPSECRVRTPAPR